MHMLTLRVFSKRTDSLVVDQTTMVDHLERLASVTQTFTLTMGDEQHELTDEVIIQLEFDPPLVLNDDPGPTPQ